MEQAAHQLSADNTKLACAFIQKTAVEKVVSEMEKRLSEVSVVTWQRMATTLDHATYTWYFSDTVGNGTSTLFACACSVAVYNCTQWLCTIHGTELPGRCT